MVDLVLVVMVYIEVMVMAVLEVEDGTDDQVPILTHQVMMTVAAVVVVAMSILLTLHLTIHQVAF